MIRSRFAWISFALASSVSTRTSPLIVVGAPDPGGFELVGHVGPEHFDLEAAIELTDVANLDSLPEHRLAIAFYGPLSGSHMQEIDEISVGGLGLLHEIAVVLEL